LVALTLVASEARQSPALIDAGSPFGRLAIPIDFLGIVHMNARTAAGEVAAVVSVLMLIHGTGLALGAILASAAAPPRAGLHSTVQNLASA